MAEPSCYCYRATKEEGGAERVTFPLLLVLVLQGHQGGAERASFRCDRPLQQNATERAASREQLRTRAGSRSARAVAPTVVPTVVPTKWCPLFFCNF